MSKRLKKKKKIPHLFGKVMVVYCVAFSSVVSLWALWIADKDGLEISTELGVILGLFGGELLLMCLRTILSGKEEKSDGRDSDDCSEDPGSTAVCSSIIPDEESYGLPRGEDWVPENQSGE